MMFGFELQKNDATRPRLETKNLSKAGKGELELAIQAELKQGWRAKARGHDSDGTHTAILVRPVAGSAIVKEAA